MLGNVIYYVLTNKWLFEYKTPEETKELLLKGKRSKIPSSFKKSSDTAIQAIIKAISMCWTQMPRLRPNARTVSNYLMGQYRELISKNSKYRGLISDDKNSSIINSTSFIESNNVIKVNIPPLPEDFSFSDSQFYAYLYN